MAKKQKKFESGVNGIDHNDAISFERVGAIYGKSMRTLNRWRHDGLYSFKVGKDRYTTHAKLTEFIQIQESKNKSA